VDLSPAVHGFDKYRPKTQEEQFNKQDKIFAVAGQIKAKAMAGSINLAYHDCEVSAPEYLIKTNIINHLINPFLGPSSSPAPYITVQIQQSHSSSPQSHPKHGFDTVLIGFLIGPPEPDEGRTQLIGAATEGIIMSRTEYVLYVYVLLAIAND
jgi:hypothetical protein